MSVCVSALCKLANSPCSADVAAGDRMKSVTLTTRDVQRDSFLLSTAKYMQTKTFFPEFFSIKQTSKFD